MAHQLSESIHHVNYHVHGKWMINKLYFTGISVDTLQTIYRMSNQPVNWFSTTFLNLCYHSIAVL